MTRQFCGQNEGENDHIWGKIRHCVVRAKYKVVSYFATEDEEVGRTQRK